jgi:hypothetical protein
VLALTAPDWEPNEAYIAEEFIEKHVLHSTFPQYYEVVTTDRFTHMIGEWYLCDLDRVADVIKAAHGTGLPLEAARYAHCDMG